MKRPVHNRSARERKIKSCRSHFVPQAPRVTFLLIRTRSQPKDNLLPQRRITIKILVVLKRVSHTVCLQVMRLST